MKLRKNRIIMVIVIFILLLANIVFGTFMLCTRKMDNKHTVKEVVITPGMSAEEILLLLKDEGLIRNKFMSKVYIKLGNFSMQAGTYEFNTSMNSREIIKNISNGIITNKYNVNITFKEGKNIRDYAKVISEVTNNKESDIFDLLSDSAYIDSLINDYWFLTDDIKKSGIYYPLEGYLFPETYTFVDKDVSVKEIFRVMLNHTDKILSKYKSEIEEKNLNIHEFMTLASIVELEGLYASDRATIAGVFYNRLSSGWSLGSDVTTYYAVKKDMGEYPVLWQVDIDFISPYNTRLSSMAGKLPIGPIGNPGEVSIKSCIEPDTTDYYYFVADCKTNKTVFSKTDYEHVAAVNRIKSSGCSF